MIQWFRDLRITKKITYIFGTILLIGLINGSVIFIYLHRIAGETHEITGNWLPAVSSLFKMDIELQHYRRLELQYVISDNFEKRKDFEDEMIQSLIKYQSLEKVYIPTITGLEEKLMYEQVVKQKEIFISNHSILKKLMEEGKKVEAKEFVNSVTRESFAGLIDSINKLIKFNESKFSESAVSANDIAFNVRIALILLFLTQFAIVIFTGYNLDRFVSAPLLNLKNVSNSIADGDTNVNLNIRSRDEIGELMKAFQEMTEVLKKRSHITEEIANGNLDLEVIVRSEKDQFGKSLSGMVKNLNHILAELRMVAGDILHKSKEFKNVSEALANGANTQSASVEEIAASMEEIDIMTKANADNAETANLISTQVKTKTGEVQDLMNSMSRAMDEIYNSSQNISKIVKLIDEIALQTNILALNAALEASRAGEHGKSFGVVVDEVRVLAQRSADAAKQTATLIENSLKKVENGNVITINTAQALEKILESISKMAKLSGEIADSSKQQAHRTNEVKIGINQISSVTESTAASSEQTAATSEELLSDAERLEQIVSRFNTRDSI